MRGVRWVLGVAVALAALGCDAAEPLLLDLRTDLVPAREFEAVAVEVSHVDGTTSVRHEVDVDLDYLAGARVAELGAVPRGTADVSVSLLGGGDAVVVERVIRVEVEGPIVVTALVSRTCRDVSCPADGDDAEATTCVGGRCVDPRCSELDPAACGEAACASDAECVAGAECTQARCIEGQCAVVPDDARCEAGAICEAGAGCIPPELFGACDAHDCELGPWSDPGDPTATTATRRAAGSAHGGGLTRSRDPLELLWAEGDSTSLRLAFFDRARSAVRVYLGALGAITELDPLPVEGASLARSLAVAFDPSGEPVVSALMADGLHAWRHGAGWTELPLVSAEVDAPFASTAIGLVDGDPVAAYVPMAGGVHVRRYDGAAWVEMGAGAATGTGVASATATAGDLALASSGADALLAWVDTQSGTARTYLLRWDGAAWQELDGSGSGSGIGSATGSATTPSVAFDAAGAPLVAWANQGAGSEVYAQRWSGSAWEPIGASSDGPGGLSASSESSGTPELRVLADGDLALSWVDSAGLGATTHRLSVYDGGAWSDPGLPSSVVPRVRRHVLLGGSSDDACVVFEAGGNGYASCWDGSAWSERGVTDPIASIDGTEDPSYRPAITVAADGTADVIWEELERDFGNLVYAYTRASVGGSWIERVSGVAQGMGLDDLDADRPFAFDDDGPVLGWRIGSTCLMMRRFDGADFVEYTPGSATGCGVVPDAAADTRWPVGIIGPDGQPWLAFQEHCTDWNVYVIRYTGTAWEFVGGANCVSRGASDLRRANRPAMAVDPEGGVVLAYQGQTDTDATQQIYLRRWDGSAWQELAGSGTGAGVSASDVAAAHPAVAIDGSGRPFVAWQEGAAGATQIHARYFDGAAWVEAAGSATAGGVSGSSGAAVTPHMVADAVGRPIVFWADDGSGTSEIYARRWTGAGWQEMSGSATAGGISNGDAPSHELDVAAAGDRVCVTWREPDAAAGHVLARCLDVGG